MPADPLDAIRRHLRAVVAELKRAEQASPGAEVITLRMRGAVDTLLVDLAQLRHFLPQRSEER